MLLDFEEYVRKGNEFLHQLKTNLNNEDRAHAARILRSTFRVLRNHISMEESLQLLAQLPMAIKSVYVEGWQIRHHRKIKTVDEFCDEILKEEGAAAWRDYSNKEEILSAVRAVVNTMGLYVNPEEMDQAIHTLPKKIQEVVRPG
jgi:uncharacterized protein (DUF2267 family)